MIGLDWSEVARVVDAALAEDIGRGDITSAVAVPEHARGDFTINARQPMVVAGIDVAAYVFRDYVPDSEVELFVSDGEHVDKGTALAQVRGPGRALLTCERTALNLLQFMCAVATYANSFAKAIEGTGAVMIDTRKTIPGLRELSKYAVRIGGVRNHRMRLDDGVLIKDNHIAIAGGVRQAVEGVKMKTPLLTKIEVEVDTLEQLREAIDAGADLIMLDNMGPDMMREAVRITAGRVPLEASGGITLQSVRAAAETGVNFISSGRITQSPPAVDIGLDVRLDV